MQRFVSDKSLNRPSWIPFHGLPSTWTNPPPLTQPPALFSCRAVSSDRCRKELSEKTETQRHNSSTVSISVLYCNYDAPLKLDQSLTERLSSSTTETSTEFGLVLVSRSCNKTPNDRGFEEVTCWIKWSSPLTPSPSCQRCNGNTGDSPGTLCFLWGFLTQINLLLLLQHKEIYWGRKQRQAAKPHKWEARTRSFSVVDLWFELYTVT